MFLAISTKDSLMGKLISMFGTFVLMVHVELKGALEAGGARKDTEHRASGLARRSWSAEKENEI